MVGPEVTWTPLSHLHLQTPARTRYFWRGWGGAGFVASSLAIDPNHSAHPLPFSGYLRLLPSGQPHCALPSHSSSPVGLLLWPVSYVRLCRCAGHSMVFNSESTPHPGYTGSFPVLLTWPAHPGLFSPRGGALGEMSWLWRPIAVCGTGAENCMCPGVARCWGPALTAVLAAWMQARLAREHEGSREAVLPKKHSHGHGG